MNRTILTPARVTIEATPTLLKVKIESDITGELIGNIIETNIGKETSVVVKGVQAEYTITEEESTDPHEQIAKNVGLKHLEGDIWTSRTRQFRKTPYGFEVIRKDKAIN